MTNGGVIATPILLIVEIALPSPDEDHYPDDDG